MSNPSIEALNESGVPYGTPPEAKPAVPVTAKVTALAGKKDSTNELPMFDLGEAINFVSKIHEEALETSPMPDVAKGMGYTNPSSTPFYRRSVAARLFGLMSKSGAELSAKARDYLKPDREETKQSVLREGILGIPLYSEILAENSGKKLNVQFVANRFAKALTLTDGCAMTCAKAFEGSLRFAGLIQADGVVGATMQSAPAALVQAKSVEPSAESTPAAQESSDTQTHTLFLDKQKLRKFSITAPLEVSKAEFGRITKWLEAVLDVPEEGKPGE